MNSTIKISSTIDTNRILFVFDLVFKQLLGIDYEIVPNNDLVNISYSESNQNSDSIHIPLCNQLLNSRGYEPIQVPFKNSGIETILFPSEDSQSQWNFDLFTAIFYLVSRYEEYKGFEPDSHHRFPPVASILHKTRSFEYPLVNIWVLKLKQELSYKWPQLIFNVPKFKFISTIDIDSSYQYTEKGFLWSLSGFIKDIIKADFEQVNARFKSITRLKKDAFDVYEEINQLHSSKNTDVIFFFLLGDYAPFDKNINWRNKKQAALIKKLNVSNSIGIHPSYQSNINLDLLEEEIYRLEFITGNKISISRQHFLIHSFPNTYHRLIENGIKIDHTMGYTSQFGFRAGIASPFYFYDLSQEITTELLLFPFCSMDITPLYYYKFNTEQAIEKNRELLKKVKDVNGTFISLWHNESLSGKLRWKGGWPKVYEQLIKDAAELTT